MAESHAAPAHGVPAGGVTGQVLSKTTGTDYDAGWQNTAAKYKLDVITMGASVVAPTTYQLTDIPTEWSPAVAKNGVVLVENRDYTVDYTTGILTLLVDVTAGDVMTARYQWGTAATITPVDFPGMVAWLRAESVAQANATPVHRWNDSSGNGHHFTDTGLVAPTFELAPANFNGHPALLFDFLNRPGVGLSTPHKADLAPAAMTIYAAIEIMGDGRAQSILFKQDAAGHGIDFVYNDGIASYEFDANMPTPPGPGQADVCYSKPNGIADTGAPMVVAVTIDDTGHAHIYRNADATGEVHASDGIAWQNATDGGAMFLGSHSTLDGGWPNYYLADLIVCNAAHTQAQITSAQSYFHARYAI